MRVQGQRVGAGPSAIRAERVRARARTEGVWVRARAVRRCGEGRRCVGRWVAHRASVGPQSLSTIVCLEGGRGMSGFPYLEIVDKLRQLITVHDRVMSWTSLLSAFTNPKLRHERAPGIPATPGAGTVSTPRGVYDESSRQHRATSQQHLLPSTFWPSSASSGSSWMQDCEASARVSR